MTNRAIVMLLEVHLLKSIDIMSTITEIVVISPFKDGSNLCNKYTEVLTLTGRWWVAGHSRRQASSCSTSNEAVSWTAGEG